MLKVAQIIIQFVIVQAEMAEIEDTLNCSCWGMVNHPLKVFKLQVSNTYVAYYAFFTQFHQCRQCLINHLLQAAGEGSLELYVMYVDKVNMINVEALHALIDALSGTLGAVIPGVHAILAVAAHLG